MYPNQGYYIQQSGVPQTTVTTTYPGQQNVVYTTPPTTTYVNPTTYVTPSYGPPVGSSALGFGAGMLLGEALGGIGHHHHHGGPGWGGPGFGPGFGGPGFGGPGHHHGGGFGGPGGHHHH